MRLPEAAAIHDTLTLNALRQPYAKTNALLAGFGTLSQHPQLKTRLQQLDPVGQVQLLRATESALLLNTTDHLKGSKGLVAAKRRDIDRDA